MFAVESILLVFISIYQLLSTTLRRVGGELLKEPPLNAPLHLRKLRRDRPDPLHPARLGHTPIQSLVALSYPITEHRCSCFIALPVSESRLATRLLMPLLAAESEEHPTRFLYACENRVMFSKTIGLR